MVHDKPPIKLISLHYGSGYIHRHVDMLLLSSHSLGSEGVRFPDGGPPAIFSVHLASSSVIPAGSVHKSRGDNVVCMWV